MYFLSNLCYTVRYGLNDAILFCSFYTEQDNYFHFLLSFNINNKIVTDSEVFANEFNHFYMPYISK